LENQLNDIKATLSAGSPVAADYFAKQDAAFKAGQVGKVTGDPKTDSLNVGIAGNFTVGDFLRQPGNVFDLDKQYADAKARGAPTKELYALLDAKDAILASDLATHPEVRAYLVATDQLKYADGSYKAPSSGGSSTYRAPSKSSKPFVPYTAAEKKAYAIAQSGGKAYTSGGASSTSATPASTFFNEYKALTKGTPEYKAVVADQTVRDLLAASVAKTATPAQYTAALTALREDVKRVQGGGSATVGLPGSASAAAASPLDLAGQNLYGTPSASVAHNQAVFAAIMRGGTYAGLPGSGGGYTAPARAVVAAPSSGGLPGSGGATTYTAAQRAAYGAQFTAAQKRAYGLSKHGVAA
jgi:hypothetical protein